jgi:hypothetical protein
VLQLESYAAQTARWPKEGRHLLAQFDAESVVVYQAYRPSIASFAVANQHFGGDDFSFARMSWVKPGFLWMMYRSSWGTAESQERILALRVRRSAFDAWLTACVPSSFDRERFAAHEEWQQAVARSDVRLQWDPDHDPAGKKLARRAIQIGLRGAQLAGFRGSALVRVDDISGLVAEQRERRDDHAALTTPIERPYPIPSVAVHALGLARDHG